MNQKLLFITVTCLLLLAANGLAQNNVVVGLRAPGEFIITDVTPDGDVVIRKSLPAFAFHPELTQEEVAALVESGNFDMVFRNDGAVGRVTQSQYVVVDPSQMYLPPRAPEGGYSEAPQMGQAWAVPEDPQERQQLQVLAEQVNAGMEGAMMRGLVRSVWNGQGTNLMAFSGAMVNPDVATAWGIAPGQIDQIADRVNTVAVQMENSKVAFGHNIMAELGMTDPTVIPDNRALPDVETVMRMQIERLHILEDSMEQMGSLMNTAIADAFDEFLTPEQLRTIQESQLANIGELPVFSPSIFEALDLTDAQREQMEQIKRELEPDFEATLDSWVDGFIATQKRVEEEWGKGRSPSVADVSLHDSSGNMREFDGKPVAPGEVIMTFHGENGELAQYVIDQKVLEENLDEIIKSQEASRPSQDDIRKRLFAEDPVFRRISEEMQSKSKEFAERFKIEMFDVLTDEQWARLQELIAHPPEHALAFRKALREMLNLGEDEGSESKANAAAGTEAGGIWIPGPGAWRPGDAVPVRIQEQRESRFPRGE